jgi:hypothetical protein
LKSIPTPHIVVRPLGRGRYAALLDRRELCRSSTPFFAAARRLLAQGHDPSMLLTMSHEGSAIVSMRSTIGRAAGLTIEELQKGSIRVCRLRTTAAKGVFTQLTDARPLTAKVGSPVSWVAGRRETPPLADASRPGRKTQRSH